MAQTYTPVQSKEHRGWYEIPGFSGCCANRNGKILTKKTGHITKGGNAGRYLKVSAYKDGNDSASLYHVHDLVCRAFHGPPQNGDVVLHDNDQRWDNRPGNLSWGTQSQNIKDVYARGLRKSASVERYRSGAAASLFHISFQGDIAGLWTPRLPHGSELAGDGYTEPATPRISVAPTIEGCLRGVFPNIEHVLEARGRPFTYFHVYAPQFTGQEEIIIPDVQTQERWVWDAHITQEHWICSPVKMVHVGRIKVFNTAKSPALYGHPFGDTSLKKWPVGPRDIKWQRVSGQFRESRLVVSAETEVAGGLPAYYGWSADRMA